MSKYDDYAKEHNITRDQAVAILCDCEDGNCNQVDLEDSIKEVKEEKAIKVTKEYKVARKTK